MEEFFNYFLLMRDGFGVVLPVLSVRALDGAILGCKTCPEKIHSPGLFVYIWCFLDSNLYRRARVYGKNLIPCFLKFSLYGGAHRLLLNSNIPAVHARLLILQRQPIQRFFDIGIPKIPLMGA